MHEWVLRVQLDGEWEQCTFGTRQEALASFVALNADYPVVIERAILFRQMSGSDTQAAAPKPQEDYIN